MTLNITLGLQKHRDGDHSGAESIYREIISMAPADVDAPHLLGLLMHETGRSQLGLRWIEEAIQHAPHLGILHNSRSVVLLSLERFEEAEQSATQAISADPRLTEPYFNLGLCQLHRMSHEEAEISFRQVTQRDRGHHAAHFQLGKLAELQSDDWAAEASFREALGAPFAIELPPCRNAAVALACLLIRQRRSLDEAIDWLKRIVQYDDNHGEAHLQLGIAYGMQTDHVSAEKHLRSSIQVRPDWAASHYNLSVCLLALGKTNETIKESQLACQLDDRLNYRIHHASVLRRCNQLDDAADLLDELLNQNPDDTKTIRELAEVHIAKGEMNRAFDCFSRIIKLDPSQSGILLKASQISDGYAGIDRVVALCVDVLKSDANSVPAHLTLGLILSSKLTPEHRAKLELAERTQLTQRALEHLQKAAMGEPSAETFDAWATALLRVGQHTEAITRLTAGLELNDQFGKSYESRGRAFLELGQLNEAIDDFRRAVALNLIKKDAFLAAESHFELARLDGRTETEQAISQLTKTLKATGIHARDRTLLHFALARRLEIAGDIDGAFEQFQSGNRENAKADGFDLPPDDSDSSETHAMHRQAEDLMDVFIPAFFSEIKSECVSKRPIFIVGMPRSGTTLTEQILASHPQVFGAGERSEISDLSNSLPRRLGMEGTPIGTISKLDSANATGLGNEYTQCIESLMQESAEPTQDVRRITDKMPTNFWHLGLIAAILPGATVVHVRRDPRDVFWSCFKQNLSWPFCDLKAVKEYYHQYVELMDHWREVLPIKMYELSYEDLVTDTERHSRRLVQACDLEWNDACLNFSKNERAVQTPSKWQVRQPIYRSSVGAWKRYERQLGAEFAKFGVDER